MIPETPASLPSHFVEHERFAVLEVARIVCIPAHVYGRLVQAHT